MADERIEPVQYPPEHALTLEQAVAILTRAAFEFQGNHDAHVAIAAASNRLTEHIAATEAAARNGQDESPPETGTDKEETTE